MASRSQNEVDCLAVFVYGKNDVIVAYHQAFHDMRLVLLALIDSLLEARREIDSAPTSPICVAFDPSNRQMFYTLIGLIHEISILSDIQPLLNN